MFDDAITLLQHLEENHDPNVHLYRGQTRRFVHDWDDGNGSVPLEALYPTDFRFITKYAGASQLRAQDISAARDYGREIRNLFTKSMTLRALSGDPAYAWLAVDLRAYMDHLTKLASAKGGSKNLIDIARESEEDISTYSIPLFQLFWSLAQHYLMATALTDVTFSPRVAAWFATHPWNPSEQAPTQGSGVIYRFRRPYLEEVLERESKSMTTLAYRIGEARPPDLFFADIRRVPATFAKRPSGQQGGSIYGFDQPRVLRAVFESGAAEVFEFRHSENAASLASLRKVAIPDDDHFIKLKTAIESGLTSIKTRFGRMNSELGLPGGAAASEYLGRLIVVARLSIDSARFSQRISLEDDYVAYHYVDIESHGSHGYAHLLAIVNERTQGVLGYVSSEPLGGVAIGVKLFILVTWLEGRRAVTGVDGGLDSSERFIEQAIPLAKKAVGSGKRIGPSSEIDKMLHHVGGNEHLKESLEKAFRLGDVTAGVNLGSLLAEESRFEEAESIWREAIELGSADAAHNLGVMCFGLQQLDRSESACRIALELGDREANYCLGKVFEAKEDWIQAEHFFRRAFEQDGDPRAPNNLGIALLHLDRANDAEYYFGLGHEMGDELAGENLNSLLKRKSDPK